MKKLLILLLFIVPVCSVNSTQAFALLNMNVYVSGQALADKFEAVVNDLMKKKAHENLGVKLGDKFKEGVRDLKFREAVKDLKDGIKEIVDSKAHERVGAASVDKIQKMFYKTGLFIVGGVGLYIAGKGILFCLKNYFQPEWELAHLTSDYDTGPPSLENLGYAPGKKEILSGIVDVIGASGEGNGSLPSVLLKGGDNTLLRNTALALAESTGYSYEVIDTSRFFIHPEKRIRAIAALNRWLDTPGNKILVLENSEIFLQEKVVHENGAARQISEFLRGLIRKRQQDLSIIAYANEEISDSSAFNFVVLTDPDQSGKVEYYRHFLGKLVREKGWILPEESEGEPEGESVDEESQRDYSVRLSGFLDEMSWILGEGSQSLGPSGIEQVCLLAYRKSEQQGSYRILEEETLLQSLKIVTRLKNTQ